MKKVFYHITRVFSKCWFIILLACTISPIVGLGVLILFTIISMVFSSEPVEEKNIDDYFTDEDMKKMDKAEELDDDEYLTLVAKFQTYQCPKKVDPITTWTSSELTKDAYVYNYEINDKKHMYRLLDMNDLKNQILSRIDKQNDKIQRIIATNRNLVFRYRNYQKNTIEDVVLTTNELRS
jgi:hypothetical protein